VKFSLRVKLFVGSFALVSLSFAAADVYLTGSLGATIHGFVLATGAAFFAALVVSGLAGPRLADVLESATDAAVRMTRGDFSVRTRVAGHDEVAELARALDELAESLAHATSEMRAERDLLRRVLEGMQEGVLVLDARGRVVLVNGALRATLLLGGDIVGKLFLEVVRDAALHELLERARRSGTSEMGEIELPGIKPCRLLVHVAPLATSMRALAEGDRNSHAGEEGLLAVLVDVTELRRLESMRRDFVANVSHELRTPVAAMRSAAETLRAGALADPVAAGRFVDIIDRNAMRLQALIEDLLELSRLESKEFRLKEEPVDVRHAVAVAIGLFREKASKKGIRLRAELPRSVEGLRADPRALEQVLSNLIDNAIKYCPAGAGVTVSVAEEPGTVRLAVADTGPGIEPKHLPRIFERFYRVDKGRSRDVGGTGLGLSIVKHLAEAMGGTVAVTSEPGKGSTFAVTLPLHKEEASEAGEDRDDATVEEPAVT
jgi:two-component system, OmpR family, phosphate regulon sensor histidine kinase PhoR